MLIDPRDVSFDDLTLRFDEDGAPTDVITMVDLDSVTDFAEFTQLVARRPDRIGLIGMTASQHLPIESAPLLAELTFTLLNSSQVPPPGTEHMTVTVPDPALRSAAIVTKVASAPRAAATAFALLDVEASIVDRVVSESFAHSMLRGGPEFEAWRDEITPRHVDAGECLVQVERTGGKVEIVLDHAARRNALGRSLRLQLVEALGAVERDPSVTEVVISGNGPTFSSGDDLDEFVQPIDIAAAHADRMALSPGLALHRVADRATVILHGICFGAGVEVSAFAGRVVARPSTALSLPQIGMGLTPGAGGTASIRQRIGRWRTAYMTLSGASIDVDQALDWGLIDEIAPA